MYLSQRADLFERVARGSYRLRAEHHRVISDKQSHIPSLAVQLNEKGDEIAEEHNPDNLLAEELDDIAFVEGAAIQVTINRYERDPDAREACIAKHGHCCQVCGFDFAALYGEQFEGFIHVHHVVPLASIGTDYTVDPVSDLIPVCPNCHAIMHRRNPCFSIEQVRQMIASTSWKHATDGDSEEFRIIRVPLSFLSELEKEPRLTPGLQKLGAMMRGEV